MYHIYLLYMFSWHYKREGVFDVPGHGWLLHGCSSVSFPGHHIPPMALLGLLQLLVRYCDPPWQEWEQSENDVQFPQLPCMLSAIKPYTHKVVAFYISILNDSCCSTGEFDQIMVSNGCCGFFGLNQLSGFGWLVVLRLNVPVNNFSVMSGRSHRFLGN